MNEARSRPSGRGLKHALVGLVALFLVSACASHQHLVSGPYLQLRSPMDDQVLLQMTFATTDNCAVILEQMLRDEFINAIKDLDFFACTDASASAELPYHVTLREPTIGLTVTVETHTLELCRYFSDNLPEGLKKQNGGGGVSSASKSPLIMPCEKK